MLRLLAAVLGPSHSVTQFPFVDYYRRLDGVSYLGVGK